MTPIVAYDMQHMGKQQRGFTHTRTRESRGFTLIELLVVIAIIGILSSVVLASLNGARKKGRDARRISDLKQLQLALEMCYDAGSTCTGGATEYPDALSALAPTYISTVPLDPQTGLAYGYYNLLNDNVTDCAVAGGVCSSYVLRATMEGAVPAGSITGTRGGENCSTALFYCIQP